MTETSSQLRVTPLFEEHVRLDAKMVPYAGFRMPVQYPTGIRAEHEAVRTTAGLFDVSHMGEFSVGGPDAPSFVSFVTTNDPARLEVGHAQYSAMCYEDGGTVDDLVVYRLGGGSFRLVVNAANIEKDWQHISALADGFDVVLGDESEAIALLALQGPLAQEILAPLTDTALDDIGFYRFSEGEVAGASAVISRTGYTGEDGFELYVQAADAEGVWRSLLNAGPVTPCGLGARDTLRLEMGYALYGNDMNDQITPLEAGLGWLVKLDKGEFVGREALASQKSDGLSKKLTGFRLTDRGFPRPGHDVRFDGELCAVVQSGTVSPTLGYGIGTAFLPPSAKPGDSLQVVIRDREIEGEVVRMPFYTEGSLRR